MLRKMYSFMTNVEIAVQQFVHYTNIVSLPSADPGSLPLACEQTIVTHKNIVL